MLNSSMLNKFGFGPGAVGVALLGSVAVTTVSAHAAPAADDCLAKPNSTAPTGSHWYYRIDRAKHRNCWYIGPARSKVRSAEQSPRSTATARVPQAAQTAAVSPLAAAQFDGASAQAEPASPRERAQATPPARDDSVQGEVQKDPQGALEEYAATRVSEASPTSGVTEDKQVAVSPSTTIVQKSSSPENSGAQSEASAVSPVAATADVTAGPTTTASLLMLVFIAAAFAGVGFLVRAMIRALTRRRRSIARRSINWDAGAPPELPAWLRSPRASAPEPVAPAIHEDAEERLRQLWREIGRRAA